MLPLHSWTVHDEIPLISPSHDLQEEAAAEAEGKAVDAPEAAEGVGVEMEEVDVSDVELPFQDVEQAGSRYPRHDCREPDQY